VNPKPEKIDWPTEPPTSLETKGVSSHVRVDRSNPRYVARVEQRDRLVAKMREAGYGEIIKPIAECSTEGSVRLCLHCGERHFVSNHCDHRLCPICAPRLAAERTSELNWWIQQIREPKHVVLTCSNFPTLTKNLIRAQIRKLAMLRRQAAFKSWRGGCWSLEITNEGRGWHLHFHLLVDADWIDPKKLSQAWGKLVGQNFAVVWVKDARNSSYMKEVTKYVVKPDQLYEWPAEQIAQFATALIGVRTFGTFGSLFRRREAFKQWREEQAAELRKCPICGHTEFEWFATPEEAERRWLEMERFIQSIHTTPDPPDQQPALF